MKSGSTNVTVRRDCLLNLVLVKVSWFHFDFDGIAKTINGGIAQLKEFDNVERPQELWAPFKSMLQQLQHIAYRRSVLKLEDVSPALKLMRGLFGTTFALRRQWNRCQIITLQLIAL